MNHEDYISNQIAVYKNSKTLLEFQDKLKVAPITSYAHIHASGEKGADGRRMHSLIGVLMNRGVGETEIKNYYATEEFRNYCIRVRKWRKRVYCG